MTFFTLTFGMQRKYLMLPSIHHQTFVRLSSEVAIYDVVCVQVVLVGKKNRRCEKTSFYHQFKSEVYFDLLKENEIVNN